LGQILVVLPQLRDEYEGTHGASSSLNEFHLKPKKGKSHTRGGGKNAMRLNHKLRENVDIERGYGTLREKDAIFFVYTLGFKNKWIPH